MTNQTVTSSLLALLSEQQQAVVKTTEAITDLLQSRDANAHLPAYWIKLEIDPDTEVYESVEAFAKAKFPTR